MKQIQISHQCYISDIPRNGQAAKWLKDGWRKKEDKKLQNQ